jgi:hypothetical protein
MIERPARGGETGWIDTAAAYDALPPAMKQRIEGLEARFDYVVNILDMRFGKPSGLRFGSMGTQNWGSFPPVAHTLVWTHPESGRKSLVLSPDPPDRDGRHAARRRRRAAPGARRPHPLRSLHLHARLAARRHRALGTTGARCTPPSARRRASTASSSAPRCRESAPSVASSPDANSRLAHVGDRPQVDRVRAVIRDGEHSETDVDSVREVVPAERADDLERVRIEDLDAVVALIREEQASGVQDAGVEVRVREGPEPFDPRRDRTPDRSERGRRRSRSPSAGAAVVRRARRERSSHARRGKARSWVLRGRSTWIVGRVLARS